MNDLVTESMETLAEALCHEYHPMHWDVAYDNRARRCEPCRMHAGALIVSGVVRPADEVRAEALRDAADEQERMSMSPRALGSKAVKFKRLIFATWLRERAALAEGGGDR